MSDIAVIDCQASWDVYTDRFRELFPEADIYYAPEKEFPNDPDAVVITGSTSSIMDQEVWIEELISRTRGYIADDIPVLGICFGFQVIAKAFGGNVRRMEDWEIGYEPIEFDGTGIFDSVRHVEFPFSVHQDTVSELPQEFKVRGRSERCIQAAEHVEKPVFGVQFHPELTPEICRKSINGKDISDERKQKLLEKVNHEN